MPRALRISDSPRFGSSHASSAPGSVFLGAFNKSIADELQKRLATPSKEVALNPQQQAVLDWIGSGDGSAVVNALAGTGKTTALLAFASSISSSAQASTLHSIGFRLFRKIRQSCQVDSGKVRGMVYEAWPFDRQKPENRTIAAAAIQTISLAKQSGFGLDRCADVDSDADWAGLIDYYELDDELPASLSPAEFISKCQDIYTRSLDLCYNTGQIDFDDMILAPLYYGEKRPEMFDWVMIDELQDLNQTRKMLSLWVLKSGGRFVGVGDPQQAIFGFTGAMSDAMAQIALEVKATQFPLSVSYRCPKAVVRLAQQWVPHFEAHPSAPEGVVKTIGHTLLWREKFNPATDVLLCRNTRPLVGVADRLRDQGRDCCVVGQSAAGLVKLALKWGPRITVHQMVENVGQYLADESKQWEQKGRLDKVERLTDKCGIVTDAARKLGPSSKSEDVAKALERKFGEGEARAGALLLSTVHRYKGKEAERVYLVGRNRYMPSRLAKTDEAKKQESNLQYVACTRAKKELIEVEVPMSKKGDGGDWWDREV